MATRWFTRLSFVAVVLTSVIGVVLLMIVKLETLDGVASDIRETGAILRAVRLMLIVTTIGAWPSLLRICQRRRWIDGKTHTVLLAARWRLAAWLIALELILGYQALNRLHALLRWRVP